VGGLGRSILHDPPQRHLHGHLLYMLNAGGLVRVLARMSLSALYKRAFEQTGTVGMARRPAAGWFEASAGGPTGRRIFVRLQFAAVAGCDGCSGASCSLVSAIGQRESRLPRRRLSSFWFGLLVPKAEYVWGAQSLSSPIADWRPQPGDTLQPKQDSPIGPRPRMDLIG
jgi:hypothetical protein